MTKLLFEDIKVKSKNKYLRSEYIFRVYPIRENAVVAFDALGYKNNEHFVSVFSTLPREKDNEQLILNEAMSNLFNHERKAIWNNLVYNKDYRVEITEIINHRYEPGLTWDDIKAL